MSRFITVAAAGRVQPRPARVAPAPVEVPAPVRKTSARAKQAQARDAGSRTQRVRDEIEKLRDEQVSLTAAQAHELAKGLTPAQVRELRAACWAGAVIEPPPEHAEKIITALHAKGLAYRTGEVTRAGRVLGTLLPAELEADHRGRTAERAARAAGC